MTYDAAAYIKRNEGLRLTLYKCTAGAHTIGYGHNLDARGISRSVAELIFGGDLNDAKVTAGRFWTSADDYDFTRFVAVTDLAFNLGADGLFEFHRLRSALANRDFEAAALELEHSRYAAQLPARSARNAFILRTGLLPPLDY